MAATALVGCSPLISSGACVDWVLYDTPTDAATEADAVVIGSVIGPAGTATEFGLEANVWRVAATTWVQGRGGSEIEVVSAPRTCENGAPYPDGDPLDVSTDVLLFLRADGDRWMTITPYQAVLPAPTDPGIPSVWP